MSTMTATTAPSTTSTRVSWRRGLATVAVGAAATALVAAVVRAAGIELGVDGEPIPLLGFVQMVVLSGLVGLVLARQVGRTTFLRVAIALTALSCVPSVALGTTAGDKVGLVITHLVAAAIIVPRLARR